MKQIGGMIYLEAMALKITHLFINFLLFRLKKFLTTFRIFTSRTEPISWEIKTQVKRLVFLVAWRRPTLTGTRSQLPSALESLTSVFGMGTGVTSLPSSPNYEGIFLQN